MILFNSEEAAQAITITAWKSVKGTIFMTENSARYDSHTHRNCSDEQCEGIAEKGYLLCFSCRNKKNDEQYNNLTFKEWDGKTPLCIFKDDTYFWYEDEVYDYCEENEIKVEDLQLVICEPNYPSQISYDYWNDSLPDDDDDLPKELLEKLNEFNNFISTMKPLSWYAGKNRTTLKTNE